MSGDLSKIGSLTPSFCASPTANSPWLKSTTASAPTTPAAKQIATCCVTVMMKPPSLPVAGVSAAIDVQGIAGHELGRLKVQHGIDDLPHLTHPPHGVQPDEGGVRLAWVHWGLDDARRDRIDANTTVSVLDCERSRD